VIDLDEPRSWRAEPQGSVVVTGTDDDDLARASGYGGLNLVVEEASARSQVANEGRIEPE
jgi:hypothetical protein